MHETQTESCAGEAEVSKSAAETGDDEAFYCPECGSLEVNEISYEDDFGSMECTSCAYVGSPGEEFPTVVLP